MAGANTDPRETEFQREARWSGLPIPTYWTHRLQTFLPREGTEEAYKAALDFASGNAGHHFLTLVGERGTGKSHLALGLAWHWLEVLNARMQYYQVEKLLDWLRAGYDIRDDEARAGFSQRIWFLENVPLLVLDDLGAHQSTLWAKAKLDSIVDHRYLYGMRTVVTTNMDPETLELPRIASRLSEGIVVGLKCSDYRLVKARAREEGEKT